MEKIHCNSVYEDKSLGVTCPKFEYKKVEYESELNKLNPEKKGNYIPKLEKISKHLDGLEISVKDINTVCCDIVELCDVLPSKLSNELMIICFNLLSRAALNGNIEAMNDIVTFNYSPTKEDVSKILIVDNINNLDFKQIKKTLSHKLEENKSENTFVEVIKEIKQKTKLSRKERLQCSRYAKFIPNSVTITSMCFGLTSIRFALNNEWEYAVFCILSSGFFDMFDGKIARFLYQSSAFGVELDSLSDLVCFGVAPSIVLYLAAMHHFGVIGWELCLFYTCCCALRLARFNATHSDPSQVSELDLNYFVGIPAPAGALLALFPLIFSFGTKNMEIAKPPCIALFLFISGCLMICQIRTFSSKICVIDKSNMGIAIIIITILIICLTLKLWMTLVFLIALYILLIPVGAYCYSKALKATKLKE